MPRMNPTQNGPWEVPFVTPSGRQGIFPLASARDTQDARGRVQRAHPAFTVGTPWPVPPRHK